jgi:predicted RNA binding protein YcfA (HicA-like mRNA interferase family)
MPKLPPLSGQRFVSILLRFGFEISRQRGSHVILKRQTAEETIGCVVPMHQELALGTMRGILKQAKINLKDFVMKLRS